MASSAADGARPLSGSQVAPAAIEDLLRREGLKPVWWTNAPGDRYETHDHAYDKVLFCVTGSITFTLHPSEECVTLASGSRLDLPAGQQHSAAVGPRGVTCVEGWRFRAAPSRS